MRKAREFSRAFFVFSLFLNEWHVRVLRFDLYFFAMSASYITFATGYRKKLFPYLRIKEALCHLLVRTKPEKLQII